MKSLDEYDEIDLAKELERRETARLMENCDYCGRPWGTPPACRFPKRHFYGVRSLEQVKKT